MARDALPAPPYPDSVTVKRNGREVLVAIRPEDIDVRAFGRMPVDIERLLTSDFYIGAEPLAFKLGFTLWCRSWQQVPAGSLPDDDRKLCHLAGLGADLRTWKRLSKTALHGFEKCSDGRLYHAVVCEVALTAFKQLRRNSEGGKATSRKRQRPDNTENDQRLGDAQGGTPSNAPSVNGHDRPGTAIEGKGIDISKDISLGGTSRTRGKAPRRALADEADAAFERWWLSYPRREGKGQARKAFARVVALPNHPDAEFLATAARRYGETRAGQDPKFTKLPATWLNGECWLDEAAATPVAAAPPDASDQNSRQWRTRVSVFAKSGRWMEDFWGPLPGSAGCRAPPDVLAEFGYGGLALVGPTSKPAA